MAIFTTLAAIATLAQAGAGIAGLFKKEPKLPTADELSPGLSKEDEAKFLETLERRLQRRAGNDVQDVRQSAANRGAFRGGQLPQLELEARSRVGEGLADAKTQLALTRAEGTAGANRLLFSERMQRFNKGKEAAGGALGGSLANLLKLLDLSDTKPKTETNTFTNPAV